MGYSHTYKMFHPLLEDPSKLKDQDLENKILDLSRKYGIAANMGMGTACQQIITALDMYKIEQNRRQQASMQTVIKKNQDRDLDDLINVN
jgi:hypothetical protein